MGGAFIRWVRLLRRMRYKKNGAVSHVRIDEETTVTAVTGKDVGMPWYHLI